MQHIYNREIKFCHFYKDTIGFKINSKGDKQNSIRYNKSFYMSLFNFPGQIHTYGPIRLHWEGIKGKSMYYAKPIIKNRRTTISYLLKNWKKIQTKYFWFGYEQEQ